MRHSWAAALALVSLAGCGVGEQADTDSPVVAILSPENGATVGGTVVISAQVLDGFGIAKVRFMVDSQLLEEDFNAPYQVTWNTRGAGNGAHSIQVEGVDPSGNTGTASIGVTVDNSAN